MKDEKILGELVTFRNTTGLNLDGILYSNPLFKNTVIHIHGSFGNFYQNQFLRLMAKKYNNARINFLSFNLSTHDGIAEGFRYKTQTNSEEFEYVGYSVMNFDTCIDDIWGAINFAKQFSEHIVLQGHSLGCDRILHFLLETKAKFNFILIGPANSYELHSNWIYPKSVSDHIQELKNTESKLGDYEWLPINSYGIRQPPAEVYKIPITRPALLSIMEGPVFNIIRPDINPEYFIDQDCIIFIGGKDGYLTRNAEELFDFFEKRIKTVERIYIPTSNHYMDGCENEVIQKITDWLQWECYGKV